MGKDTTSGNGRAAAPTSGSGKRSKYLPRQVKGNVSWDEIDPVLLIATITALVGDGCALLIGATRDGGALALTICDGEERIKYYATSFQEMHGHLAVVYETAAGAPYVE